MKKADVLQLGSSKSGASSQGKTGQEQQCKEEQHLFQQGHGLDMCRDGDN